MICKFKCRLNLSQSRGKQTESYIADFVYKKNGETIVEDTKGVRTKEYIVKRKLMLWVHHITITEV